MLHHKGTDKSKHYLELLDAARSSGNWSDVPELIRKVGKHSPQRRCLQLTAQVEYQMVTSSTELSQTALRLQSASQEATAAPEDVFQARVCLGWLHWTLNRPELALRTIPQDVFRAYKELDHEDRRSSAWSNICAIKGVYLRGDLQEKTGNIDEALTTYQSALPHIEKTLSTAHSSSEYHVWAEQLLAQYCILSNHLIKEEIDKGQEFQPTNATLAPFRAWANISKYTPKAKSVTGSIQQRRYRPAPRRRVWQVYYDTLSVILQKRVSYPMVAQPPGSSISTNEISADNVRSLEHPRLLQIIELRNVESTYEELLIQEVSFPKANEANLEVESWADQVMANWRLTSSPAWLNEDLGKGGKEGMTRHILAILYRAASRTFHSTRVLRHLFSLHTALAEFNLAAKAFDTYVELVRRGKARVEKSGESEIGLDDDAAVLKTTAAGLQMLCFYGRRKQVERAQEIAVILEGWLHKIQSQTDPVASADDNPADLKSERSRPDRRVPEEALAAAHRSLGICRAHWARLTYETSKRPDLFDKSIASFRRASDYATPSTESAEIHYALAVILAETRDTDAAIQSTKQAISLCTHDDMESAEFERFSDTQEDQNRRVLFKAWHHLAFLLSARQDFATAIASCEAAGDLYSDLFESFQHHKVVEKLALAERESIIELKMSQLVLSEILDGSEEAVNACGDLLGLYKQLFGHTEASDAQAPAVAAEASNGTVFPPRTANGTIKSTRRSLLGRSKEAVGSLPHIGRHSHPIPVTGEAAKEISRDANISLVQDESTVEKKYQPPHHLARQESKKLRKRQSRRSVASERRNRGSSPNKSSTVDGSEDSTQVLPLRVANLKRSSLETTYTGSTPLDLNRDSKDMDMTSTNIVSSDLSHPLSKKAESSRLPPNSSHTTQHQNRNLAPEFPKPPSSGSSKAPPISSQQLFSLPDPIYPSTDLNRHALTLLTRIWLFIAQLYRDASMPLDAQGALSEAFQQAQSIETLVATIESSAQALSTPGWGNLKSVAEIWADVHAEQAALHLQLGNTDAASEAYEKALGWFPDHNAATVGLCNILLDYYDREEPMTAKKKTEMASPNSKPVLASLPPTSNTPEAATEKQGSSKMDESPKLLSRLAARDRAFGLLSMLTKSGRGWDDSEAWSALARAYELSGQVGKAKEAFWWVVELEDSRPLREWRCVGGF